MKTIIAPALLCIALTPTAAFTSLRVALPKTGRELRRATTELPLTVDAMGAPLTAATLPAGKRVVRRRQTRVSSELESEDVAHAPVNVSIVMQLAPYNMQRIITKVQQPEPLYVCLRIHFLRVVRHASDQPGDADKKASI